MQALEQAIRAGDYLTKRRKITTSGNFNNVVNNLSARTSPDLLDCLPWEDAVIAAQLLDTYYALIDEFPDFKKAECGAEYIYFRKFAELPIEQYVLEAQKELRKITYEDVSK